MGHSDWGPSKRTPVEHPLRPLGGVLEGGHDRWYLGDDQAYW